MAGKAKDIETLRDQLKNVKGEIREVLPKLRSTDELHEFRDGVLDNKWRDRKEHDRFYARFATPKKRGPVEVREAYLEALREKINGALT